MRAMNNNLRWQFFSPSNVNFGTLKAMQLITIQIQFIVNSKCKYYIIICKY